MELCLDVCTSLVLEDSAHAAATEGLALSALLCSRHPAHVAFACSHSRSNLLNAKGIKPGQAACHRKRCPWVALAKSGRSTPPPLRGR